VTPDVPQFGTELAGVRYGGRRLAGQARAADDEVDEARRLVGEEHFSGAARVEWHPVSRLGEDAEHPGRRGDLLNVHHRVTFEYREVRRLLADLHQLVEKRQG
jgi:hypothetical protein